MLLLKNALVYWANQREKKDILIEAKRIKAIKDEIKADCPVLDLEGKTLIPGFFDIHTHGASLVDVNIASTTELIKLAEFFSREGTTSWFPSILTDTKDQTKKAILNVLEVMAIQEQETRGARIEGIHLEGPFLAKEYKGAMPEHLLLEANLELVKEYQECAKGQVRYMTVAPEVKGVIDLIPELVKLGITVGLGHTGASYELCKEAIYNGAKLATHCFNAMRMVDHHAPMVSGALLESDCYVEAITDGLHLHPGIVRLLLKTKGLSRLIPVTDSMMAAGCGDGEYSLGVNEIIVKDGDARLKHGNARAGSTLTASRSFANLQKFTNLSIGQISQLMSENPAKLFQIEDIARMRVNNKADLLVLDEKMQIETVFIDGHQIE